MPERKVGTREEWQAARDELAKLEAEIATSRPNSSSRPLTAAAESPLTASITGIIFLLASSGLTRGGFGARAANPTDELTK